MFQFHVNSCLSLLWPYENAHVDWEDIEEREYFIKTILVFINDKENEVLPGSLLLIHVRTESQKLLPFHLFCQLNPVCLTTGDSHEPG